MPSVNACSVAPLVTSERSILHLEPGGLLLPLPLRHALVDCGVGLQQLWDCDDLARLPRVDPNPLWDRRNAFKVMVERFGWPDVLANPVGYASLSTVLEVTDEALEENLLRNPVAMFYGIQADSTRQHARQPTSNPLPGAHGAP